MNSNYYDLSYYYNLYNKIYNKIYINKKSLDFTITTVNVPMEFRDYESVTATTPGAIKGENGGYFIDKRNKIHNVQFIQFLNHLNNKLKLGWTKDDIYENADPNHPNHKLYMEKFNKYNIEPQNKHIEPQNKHIKPNNFKNNYELSQEKRTQQQVNKLKRPNAVFDINDPEENAFDRYIMIAYNKNIRQIIGNEKIYQKYKKNWIEKGKPTAEDVAREIFESDIESYTEILKDMCNFKQFIDFQSIKNNNNSAFPNNSGDYSIRMSSKEEIDSIISKLNLSQFPENAIFNNLHDFVINVAGTATDYLGWEIIRSGGDDVMLDRGYNDKEIEIHTLWRGGGKDNIHFGYVDINNICRNTQLKEVPDKLGMTEEEIIQTLDSSIDRSIMIGNMVHYRRVGIREGALIKSLRSGEPYQSGEYISTSPLLEFVENFNPFSNTEEPITIRFNTKTGDKAVSYYDFDGPLEHVFGRDAILTLKSDIPTKYYSKNGKEVSIYDFDLSYGEKPSIGKTLKNNVKNLKD